MVTALGLRVRLEDRFVARRYGSSKDLALSPLWCTSGASNPQQRFEATKCDTSSKVHCVLCAPHRRRAAFKNTRSVHVGAICTAIVTHEPKVSIRAVDATPVHEA
ncbi:hypothetical protein NDU88_004155 [Pleurodeles waltl]|uniref:Uncharacterized protein n=1 Tax=Pleurodeles waltl TaxID=8319 RepID=A0AAV7W874_PLEWA|nr:hypothetical protein NDU88_004155 [Pleurodeles waltl]